jgi:hypothetical protein
VPAIRIHSLYEAFVNITVASPRPEGVPSYIIPAAKYHDEIAAKIRGILREYKHLAENETWVASAYRVQTYLPTNAALPTGNNGYYAVRTLDPAGSIPEVDEKFMLDVLRLRYSLVFAILPASVLDDDGDAFERYWQKAFKDLFVTGYSMTGVFIPGDEMDRDDTKTTIDIQLEMGGAKGTMRFDKSPG